MNKDAIPSAAEIGEACFCLNAQRAARAVARRYDVAFRAIGLTSGQFSILAALNQEEPVMLSDLAKRLGVERTTLTRNLVALEGGKLVASQADAQDGRMRRVTLTGAGRARLEAAVPLWRAAQSDSLASMSDITWPAFRRALDQLGRS